MDFVTHCTFNTSMIAVDLQCCEFLSAVAEDRPRADEPRLSADVRQVNLQSIPSSILQTRTLRRFAVTPLFFA